MIFSGANESLVKYCKNIEIISYFGQAHDQYI